MTVPDHNSSFIQTRASLADIAGPDFIAACCEARAAIAGEDSEQLHAIAEQQVAFYPAEFQVRQRELLAKVGNQIVDEYAPGATAGAGSAGFAKASKAAYAPLTGLGMFRVGEDGRVMLISKSEHYHAPLGHSFPGYQIIEIARRLGIPNATHNNTRGQITRVLEDELVRTANGIAPGDEDALQKVKQASDLRTLNRVINLETGSLAVEAALKMILARFYRCEDSAAPPQNSGVTPVMLVMGNDEGELPANYHGTTMLTQVMRGMWPELKSGLENNGLFAVRTVRPNSLEDLDAAFAECNTGNRKIAGFFHEIVMMNYGGRLLSREFLHHAYALCEQYDVPTVADEIQSCMWAPELYLFREYGLRPTFVAIGKGFPGGEYPASRIIFSSAMDVLPQFGALVTNGQEELAALAYLITMRWAQDNAAVTRAVGEHYQASVAAAVARHSSVIDGVDGWGHMLTIKFSDLEAAKMFAGLLTRRGLDVSAQTYKADCPPVVLTKLPLIADFQTVDFVTRCMAEAMEEFANSVAAEHAASPAEKVTKA